MDKTYKGLGLMLRNGLEFFDETAKMKSFSKGNRRYTFKDDDVALAKVKEFFIQTLFDMGTGNWKHYHFDKKEQKTFLKKHHLTSLNPLDFQTFRVERREAVQTKVEEEQLKELAGIQYIGAVNWMAKIQKTCASVYKRGETY